MYKFSTEALFKTQIDEIWDNVTYTVIESVSRGYAIQDDILTNALLFIGINPSMYGNLGRIFYQNTYCETPSRLIYINLIKSIKGSDYSAGYIILPAVL